MKLFFCLACLTVLLSLNGCLDAPGYPADQRATQIGNAMGYDLQTINDDIDNVLLLRPSSHLSDWNVYHSY
jgi:hypothetical protein